MSDNYDNYDDDYYDDEYAVKYYVDQNNKVVKADKGIVKLILAPEIKEIDSEVFKDQNALESVIIGGQCVKIGEGAFKNCSQLSRVELSSALLEISKETFSNCKSLSHILIPDSCFAIRSKAFSNCFNLKYIKIPSTVGEIAPDAFSGCRNLRVVEGPEKFRRYFNEIGVYYITTKTNYIKREDESQGLNVVLPEHILEIKSHMFACDERITSFAAGGNLKVIDDSAFKQAQLLEDVYLGDCELEKLGAEAFNDCPNLLVVVLPKSLKEIKPLTFSNCYKLEDVLFPENLEKIGDFAFAYTNVYDVDLPDTLYYLGNSAFEGCEGLEEVNLSDKVRTIPKFCFERCNNLSKINLQNVRVVEDNAFSRCYGLNILKLKVHKIGKKAFKNCFGLESAAVYADALMEEAFSGCKNLTTFKLDGKLKIITKKCFEKCENLKNIRIPDSVTKISNMAFIKCRNLSAIEVKGIEEVEDYAFWGCEKLVYLHLGENLNKFAPNAIDNCPNIRFVTAPEKFRKFFEDKGIIFTSTQEYANNIKKIDNNNKEM